MLLQSLLRPVLTPLMRGMFDAPIASSAAWSPIALWPDGIDSPGMWISPRDLTSEWADYTGTTPVVTPGTVADSANPVGLAYDLRAGTPVLGPELVVNGDFSAGMAGWALAGYTTAGTPSGGSVRLSGIAPGTNFNEVAYQTLTTVVGRTYKISFPCTFVAGEVDIACYASGSSGWFIASLPSSGDIYIQATSTTTTLTVYAWNGASTDVPFDVTVGPATAKEVPGNHMLQSTSVDRPLLSARVNLLTYSQEFTLGAYMLTSCTMEADSLIAPDGTLTADSYLTNAGNGRITNSTALPAGSIVSGVQYTMSVYCKNISGSGQFFIYCGNSPGGSSPTLTATTSWQRFTWTFTANSTGNDIRIVQVPAAGDLIAVWGAQVNIGPTALPYQPILTGSTYPSTGFPIAQLYNGTNSGMATAAFTTGTLIDGMDCMIAVRRDSAAATYLISDTASRGFFEWESGDTDRPDVSAGMPTYYVDGVAVTATRGALFTALTAGDWHILEARGLDLSTWTKVEVSSLVSYRLNGPRGDILLYPSTASTTDKDAARQWLADYYGVTLP